MESDLERAMTFAIRCAKLPNPEREYKFHPTRKWRFDFAWPEKKIALEVEGGTWVGGAHNRGAHFESDAEKYNEAAILGWRILRVNNKMVEDNRAVSFLERLLLVS